MSICAAKQERERVWHPEPALGFLCAKSPLEKKHNQVINSMNFNRKSRVIVHISNLPGWEQRPVVVSGDLEEVFRCGSESIAFIAFCGTSDLSQFFFFFFSFFKYK